ncbi:MAG: hypothetical protein A2Y33_07370 [Spirochaetes bacterium GWF1_51_8]|nr:MAG: hypothetical protein A2Y33_07370 [Spirochaetes bacterium GWF1_51_8]
MATKPEGEKSIKVDFHYIKSNQYRTSYANGVFGGITPRGELQMDFFVERQVIPQVATYAISNEGILGEIIKTEGKSGFIREFDCGVLMSIDVAINFYEWLGQKIDEFNKVKNEKEGR